MNTVYGQHCGPFPTILINVSDEFIDKGKIDSDCLLLGINTDHYRACYLSDLPIVVFDDHTDMCALRSKHYESPDNVTWLYHRAKSSPVHLVMPRYSPSTYIDINLPRHEIGDFNLYVLDEPKSPVKATLIDWSRIEISPRDPMELQDLQRIEKQVSFDLDFFRHADRKETTELLRMISGANDINDFWIDIHKMHYVNLRDCKLLLSAIDNN